MTRIVHIESKHPDFRDPRPSSRFDAICCICRRPGATLADLDGEPFQAYYHAECVSTEE